MRSLWVRSLLCAALLLVGASVASAQVSITGAVSGTVMDTSDAVLPGATVVLKDEGTGLVRESATNPSGAFAFHNLPFGSYEVTVKLQGFRTALYKKVTVESGRTTDLRIKMTLGALTETITVEGTTPVLEMTSNVISNTLSNKDVTQLPLAGRNAFTFARYVPGAVAPAGTGSTHFNGLPGGTINPTIDGVNNSSNGFKSGGTSFFGTVPARLGAVEEVTVESAGLGGDDGVTGGVNLKFITRRGTGQYQFSMFEQYRTEKLNANSFGNVNRGLAKSELRRHDFGGNFGGPINVHPKVSGKLFGFFNYEEEYIPQTQSRSQTLLTPEAQSGIFRYQNTAGQQFTGDLFTIANNAGLTTGPDPVIAAMLAKQQLARPYGVVTATTGGNALRTESLTWNEPQKQINYYPTVRFDFRPRNGLSFMGSYNRYNQDAQGRRVWPFPDFPINSDTFDSGWWVLSTGTDWTIRSNMHNELRYGVQHSGDTNEVGRQREFYLLNGTVNSLPARFTLPFVSTLAGDAAPVIGKHYITTITDTLRIVSGNHTFSIGGNYRDTQWRDRSFDGTGTAGWLGLPRYSLGTQAGDPISSVFTAGTLPGIQTADLTNAINLYALLTGRLSAVQTGKVVDPATLQYSDQVFRENWTSAWFAGVYAQDQWRVNPRFTLNYGLRWEMNQPPYSHTGVTAFPDDANTLGPSTSLFTPGQFSSNTTPVIRRGFKASDTDWNNVAPRVGFAWTPNFGDGILGTIFGRGQETVIRGGYDLTYFDEGTNMFASTAGNNPGQSQSLLLQAGTSMPHGTLLGATLPPFVAAPLAYKEVWNQSETTFSNGLSTMSSDLQTGYVNAWNIGVQRQLLKNTVVEARYLGNRADRLWRTFNVNEVNIIENGFLTEFKNARSNLQINGGTSFANLNPAGGTVALPIFEAAFGARGSQVALPGNQGFTNGGFITNLNQGEAARLASSLAGTATYLCRMVGNTFSPCNDGVRNFDAAGPYPMNFFVVNPYAIGANGNINMTTVDDDGSSRYHAMQLQLRQRYAHGVSATLNYTVARNTGDIWAENATQSVNHRTLRDKSLDFGTASFDVRQVFQALGTYDLPFGRGRRFNINNGWANAIAGGWVLGTVVTAQSGTPFRLTSGRQTFVSGTDSGVVLANGHTVEEIQRMIQIRPGPNNFSRFWVAPELVGPDGRANPEYLVPPTTPGEFGQFIVLRGKNSWSADMSLNKTTKVWGRSEITVHFTVTNIFNKPVWSSVGFLSETSIQSQTFGLTTDPINGARQVYSRVSFTF